MSKSTTPAGPDGPESRRRITALIAQGRIHDAVEQARVEVMHHADDATVWQLLAEVTIAARRWDDLANAMAKALERFPTAPWAWHAAVVAALGLGDAEDAVRVGLAGLRAMATRTAQVEDARVWEALGHAFWQLGDLPAVLDASAAIRAAGGDGALADLFELRVALARSDARRGKELGERLLARDPEALEPMSLHCAALIALGEGRAAAPLAERLVRLDPTSPTSWSMCATAHVLNDEPEQACQAQARALALAPGDGALRIGLVVYELAARRYEAARENALSLTREHAGDPAGWHLLGAAARALGDMALATHCEARVAELGGGPRR